MPHKLVLHPSQCSLSPVKLHLLPNDISVVHNIICTEMLYVTVCYVCCLCYTTPMRCRWRCCFRYIRNSSLFSCSVCLSGPIYYSIYSEIFVGTRTCKCCVALPVLNVGFMWLFLCASHVLSSFALTCKTVEVRQCHLLSCRVFELWEAGLLQKTASAFLSECFYLEKKLAIRDIRKGLWWEIELIYNPTPLPFLALTGP